MLETTVASVKSLETRLAAVFVQTAGKFKSKILLRVDNRTADAKSIMGVISLSVLDGADVVIITDGEDEKTAAEELSSLLLSL